MDAPGADFAMAAETVQSAQIAASIFCDGCKITRAQRQPGKGDVIAVKLNIMSLARQIPCIDINIARAQCAVTDDQGAGCYQS